MICCFKWRSWSVNRNEQEFISQIWSSMLYLSVLVKRERRSNPHQWSQVVDCDQMNITEYKQPQWASYEWWLSSLHAKGRNLVIRVRVGHCSWASKGKWMAGYRKCNWVPFLFPFTLLLYKIIKCTFVSVYKHSGKLAQWKPIYENGYIYALSSWQNPAQLVKIEGRDPGLEDWSITVDIFTCLLCL